MRLLSFLVVGVSTGVAFAATMVPVFGRRRSARPVGGAQPEEATRAADGSPREVAHLCQAPGMNELAGSLAHELNQPLTAITSNAQAVREYLTSGPCDMAEVREILDDIVSDASRASEIVRRVRALILGEAPTSVQFNVDEVVEQALELVGANARARGVAVSREVEGPLPRAIGDPMEIQLVLLNLLINALDAVESVRAGGERKVSILAQERDGTIEVLVRDNGCGVDPGQLERIFQPFYSSKPKGMGLGLSFSRALVERNGGRLKASRNSDLGMTFELTLRTEASAQHLRGSILPLIPRNYPRQHGGSSDERNAANGLYR
ncbi:ATP-binding protein [Cupriavidus sp. BIS7]|uniref:sensor histidine kinase n=1 Tax=Cupriavidus sp. BIS7 TaxID=1217718 RepID=UPI0002FFC2EB|nr:ATP-binding protein [Cupriavidus sp. BIS7]